jgi:mannose-6-phosphate isomerase-like protein (cupin superfamily)
MIFHAIWMISGRTISMNAQTNPHRVDVLSWDGEGYRPLVASGDWLVALMNWEHRFDLTTAGKIERHNLTDEVFVLLRGRGLLFIVTDAGVQAFDMQPGLVYNVTPGTWHSVIGTRDATWLIVEARDTSVENSDYRPMTVEEMDALKDQYPAWLR